MTLRTWTFTVLATAFLLAGAAGDSAAQSAARKAGRGLAGMTTAFLEVPGNMVRESDRRGSAEGLPLGFAMGLGMIVVRTLVGVYEFVSCPFPAPPNFRPIIEPEFPWSYFDAAPAPPPAHKRP